MKIRHVIASLLGLSGTTVARPAPSLMGQAPAPQMRARYDAAQPGGTNQAHWSLADDMSARAAHSPEVRRTLRMRCRYESANNCYVRGLLMSLANDTVGTGPMLQMSTGDRETDSRIEASWAAWAREVRLGTKLRVMVEALMHDGESFGIMTSNMAARHPVKLYLKLIEADQVATAYGPTIRPDEIDGVVVDENDIPQAYHVLRAHPGDAFAGWSATQHDVVPASSILHFFRPSRPGQLRGVPMIVPALPLLAQLRRYTLAVLAAAETAASHAGVVKTSTSPDADQMADLTGSDVPITAGTFNVLPAGWELQQLRAEQPTSTYREFKLELIDEIARCVLTPRNISTGNSSGYNYSSGRLDHQTYDRMLEILRDELRACVLDQLFAAWLNEAVLVSGLMSLPVRQMIATGGMPSHRWLYRSRGHVDPGKEASATGERIRNGTSTLADECAAEGRDWEEVMEQRIREEQTEMRARERAGLPPRVTTHPSQTPQPAAPNKQPDPQDDQEDDQ